MVNIKKEIKNIVEEISSGNYLGKVFARAQRRKSLWNTFLFFVWFIVTGWLTFLFFSFMWRIHMLFFPEHAGKMNEFWQEGLSLRAFLSSFLMAAPLFFAAFPLSAILSNLIMYGIPWARKAFEEEAVNFPETKFINTMRSLVAISIIFVPICFIVSLIGALTLKSLR